MSKAEIFSKIEYPSREKAFSPVLREQKLAVEASLKGYQGMLCLFDEDHARYESLEPLIKAYPDVEDTGKQQLVALAVQFTTGESGEANTEL